MKHLSVALIKYFPTASRQYIKRFELPSLCFSYLLSSRRRSRRNYFIPRNSSQSSLCLERILPYTRKQTKACTYFILLGNFVLFSPFRFWSLAMMGERTNERTASQPPQPEPEFHSLSGINITDWLCCAGSVVSRYLRYQVRTVKFAHGSGIRVAIKPTSNRHGTGRKSECSFAHRGNRANDCLREREYTHGELSLPNSLNFDCDALAISVV